MEISLYQNRALEDGTLDQCLAEQISPMAWSPLGGGHLGAGATRVLGSQEAYGSEPLIKLVDQMARDHGVDRSTIALAWLLKHPSGIIPIIGSIQPDRIKTAAKAGDISLSREAWYQVFLAARSSPLP